MQAWEERVMYEQEAREEGRREGRVEGVRNATQENIRNLMDSLKLSIEQAMDLLKIPVSEREKYRTMI